MVTKTNGYFALYMWDETPRGHVGNATPSMELIFKHDDDEGLYETLLEMSNSDKNILLIHAEDLMKPIQFHAYDNGYIRTDKEARELTMKRCIDYASSLNLSENCIVIIQNNIIVNSTVEEYIKQYEF